MTHLQLNRRPFDRSFNSLLDDLFTSSPVFNSKDAKQNGNGWIPVNITEQPNQYSLEVVAPGFEKGDFKINLDQNILTISLEKKDENKDENNKQVRTEYSYRSFKRSFTLDEKINADGIEARYVNGVLIVNLPKKEEVKIASKDISIQ